MNRLAVILDLVEDGRKLKPLTNHRPVASLPYGGRYRMIDFMFSSLYNAEISSAALFISGSGQSLYDHIRSGSVWGLDSNVGGGVFTHSQIENKFEKSFEEDGTVTYYENHKKYINKSRADDVLVAGSQILSSVNLNAFFQFHKEEGALVSAAFKNISPNLIKEETVLNYYIFKEKTSEDIAEVAAIDNEALKNEKIAAGLKMVIVNKKFLLSFIDFASENQIRVNAENIIKFSIEQNEKAAGFEYTGYMKAIDTIENYYKANLDMLDEFYFNSLFFRNSPIITRGHHSTPTYYGENSKVSNSQIASGSEFYGDINQSIISRDVKIGKHSTVNYSIIMSHTKIGEHVILDHVVLDKDVVIEDGVELKGTVDSPLVIEKGAVITKNDLVTVAEV